MRILANRAWTIGLDRPCENTVWRMVAVLSYCLDTPFTHEDALKHKGTIRSTINDYAKHRPRDAALPRIFQYGAADEMDGHNRAFAYGTSLPQPVDIHGAVARHMGHVWWGDCLVWMA